VEAKADKAVAHSKTVEKKAEAAADVKKAAAH
jgi:hypothetical protein